MVSCDVICDLMVVYASGEASAETERLVEEHLARCPACREALGEGQGVEEALGALEPVERPSNGRRVIARTRQLVFGLAAGTLTLFACVLVAFRRVVMEGIADIPLPHLPGPPLLWLGVAATMLAGYGALLLWRRGRQPGTVWGDLSISMLAAFPLLVVVLAAYHLVGTGGGLSVALAGLFFLAALGATLALLPSLPYMTVASVLILVLVNGLLVGGALAGVIGLGDLSWQTPAALGHPPEELALEEGAQVDLTGVGLTRTGTTETTWIDNVWIGPQAEAIRVAYEGEDRRAFLTVARFEDHKRADAFFAAWREAVSGSVQITHFEINLPGLAGQGRIWRSYEAGRGEAYSAWVTDEWVTIVAVPGPVHQAQPLAREIKESVATAFGP